MEFTAEIFALRSLKPTKWFEKFQSLIFMLLYGTKTNAKTTGPFRPEFMNKIQY